MEKQNKLKKENKYKISEKKLAMTKENDSGEEIGKLIKIVIIIVMVFGLFSVITHFVNKKNDGSNNDNNKKEEIIINYDKILISDLLNQSAKEYYVLVSKEKDAYLNVYSSYFNLYKNKESALHVFSANLDDIFNANFVAEESNLNTNNISDIKFKKTTLVKIKDNKIVISYEGSEKIIEHLKQIIK